MDLPQCGQTLREASRRFYELEVRSTAHQDPIFIFRIFVLYRKLAKMSGDMPMWQGEWAVGAMHLQNMLINSVARVCGYNEPDLIVHVQGSLNGA